MKRPVAGLLIAFTLSLLLPVGGSAADPPHDPSNGYSCSTCHTALLSLGVTGYNYVCLSCHRPGAPKAGKMPFTPADAANPFRTLTSARGRISYQTSHNWSGSDNLPAAGALPPLSPALNASKTIGSLACTRCHDQHNQTFRPFLRMANDRDQMCLDCHRTRNTRDHTTGSHPVNFNYTSSTSLVKIKPTQYNNPPLNSNPSNPTSAMKLVNGTILCSTCHGVHHTDSNSATFDSYSTYNKLKPADGYLLRTDLRGATSASLNICTNCHIQQGHNGRNQNVQCADCHAGHVDVADGTVPNAFLVRRYMNFSTAAGAVRGKKVLFQNPSVAAGNYKDAGGTGVCQACHTVPTGSSYPAEHGLTTATAAVCNNCHVHGNPAGAFSATGGGCTVCHGYPPRSGKAGGPDGPAAGYTAQQSFSDEATTPHMSHAGGAPYSYACSECHKGNSHNAGTFQDVFKDKTGIIAGTSAGYDAASRSCSMVYCHSNGGPRGGTLLYKPVSWPNGNGAIVGTAGECGMCHEAAPSSNAHTAHFSASYGPNLGTLYPSVCQNCHVYSPAANSSHVNGVVDVTAGSGSSCANCHPAAIPPWTAARLACTSCHAAMPAVLPNGVAAPYKATYGVTGHGQFAISSECTACHDPNSPHISGKLGNYTRLSLPNDNNLCASCHNDASKVPVPARQNMVSHVLVKGGPAVSACNVCHDVHGTTNLSMVKTTINGKGISFTNLSSGFIKTVPPYDGLCQVCHTATNHYRSGQAPDSHPTKLCLSCHAHKASFAFQPSGTCDSCHGYPPAPAGFVGTQGNYSSARLEDYPGGSGAHLLPIHVKKTARPAEGWINCTPCHGNGSLNPATHTMVLPVTPSKITIDVADHYKFNPALQLGPTRYNGILLDGGANATGSCSNVKCHFKPSKKWSTVR